MAQSAHVSTLLIVLRISIPHYSAGRGTGGSRASLNPERTERSELQLKVADLQGFRIAAASDSSVTHPSVLA